MADADQQPGRPDAGAGAAMPGGPPGRLPPSPAGPAAQSRRSLLTKGLLGGAILLVGGSLPVLLRGTRVARPPRRSLSSLTGDEHAIFAAVAARVCAPPEGGDTGWPTTEALDCAGKVDALMAQLHPAAAAEFKRLLRVFENAMTGLFFTGSVSTFSAAAPALQDRRLEGWRRSRVALFRSGYQAMKRLAHATYYSSPEIYARIGYPGPPLVPT